MNEIVGAVEVYGMTSVNKAFVTLEAGGTNSVTYPIILGEILDSSQSTDDG